MTTRHRLPVALAVLATVALLGTACQSGADSQSTDRAAAAPGTEEQALVQAGFETEATPAESASPEATAAASASPEAKQQRRLGLARRTLRKNTLHGEVTVQTKQGVKTVLVQRGTVTAVSSTGITVRSTDGFTEQWAFGDKVRVRVAKEKSQVKDLKAGEEVGIAGVKAGGKATARLVIAK